MDIERTIVSQERIKIVFDQTNFLVEKQRELFEIVEKTYTELLDLIAKKIEQEGDSDVLNDLSAINKNISDHYESLNSDIKEDIDFLAEQLKAITQIKDMEDKEKAEELLSMIVNKEDELVETAEFKKQVEDDLLSSTRELKTMHTDLMNALNEGKVKELRLMLEAVEEHNKDLDAQEGESCEPTDCSTCSGCDAHSTDETDIFESFKKDEENKDN